MEKHVRVQTVNYDLEELSLYRKRHIDVNFMSSIDIAKEGQTIIVPTLEGDIEVTASPDQLIMLGPCNDIYPIPRELFEAKYSLLDGQTEDSVEREIIKLGWNPASLKRCRLIKESYIYAKEVPYEFAVYVKHCGSTIYGKSGDYYVVSYEDTDNRYIIDRHIMEETYEPCSCK